MDNKPDLLKFLESQNIPYDNVYPRVECEYKQKYDNLLIQYRQAEKNTEILERLWKYGGQTNDLHLLNLIDWIRKEVEDNYGHY